MALLVGFFGVRLLYGYNYQCLCGGRWDGRVTMRRRGFYLGSRARNLLSGMLPVFGRGSLVASASVGQGRKRGLWLALSAGHVSRLLRLERMKTE
jgi:hypothetical protein